MTPDIDIAPDTKGLRDLWYAPVTVQLRRAIGRIAYRLYRLGGEITAILLGLGIALSFFVASALNRQSTDISVLRPNLQIWFAEAFNGKGADFGRLDVRWLPVQDAFVLTAEDVNIVDSDGQALETFTLLRATLKGRPEDLRRPKLVSAEVRGGVLSYVEDETGAITIGLGPPETVGRIGPVYRNDGRTAVARKIDLQSIESVQVYDATLHFRNAVSGLDIVARLDRLATTFSGEGGIVYTASGQIEQSDAPADFTVAGLTDADLSAIRTTFSLLQARPDQIAPRRGRFKDLRGVAAPVDLKGDVGFSRADGLQSASLSLGVGSGQVELTRGAALQDLAIRRFDFDADLEPGNERMTVNRIDLSAPLLSFKGSGYLTELGKLSDGDINSSPNFDLALRDISLASKPILENDMNIKRLDLKGQADADSRRLSLKDSRMDVYDARFDFDADVVLTESNRVETLAMSTKMTGELAASDLVALWPTQSLGGARRWIDRSITDGRIESIDARLNLGADFFEAPALTSERLDLTFSVVDADVQYMQTMPPVQGVNGLGRILGNRLFIDLAGGRIETIALETGTVEIAELLPKGGDIVIKGKGRGEATDMLSILNNPPFAFATRYGIDPRDLAGTGDVAMTITRPLLEFFPRERIDYDIQGDFTGIKAPFSFGRFDIENGEVALDVNRDRMILSGPIDIGPWRPQMRWQETFGDAPPPTQYAVSGLIDAGVLDGLGIASRGWYDGTAAVRIEATGRGMNVSEAVFDADLTNAALSAERVWMKPEGEAARLTGRMTRDAKVGYDLRDVSLTGEGLNVQGGVSLAPDYKLKSLDLSDVRIDGVVDGRLRADTQSGSLSVMLEGKSLDVSSWTEDAFQSRESGMDVPFDLSARLDQLTLHPDYSLREANVAFSHTGEVVQAASLSGTTDAGPLSLELTTLADSNRRAVVSVPDASRALSAFLSLSNTTGGELRLNVDLPPAGEDGAFIGEAQMRNFRLIEAPAMAQLLSIASLTGLADTLSGGGMQFDRFTVPFTMLGEQIAIRDARLYGPALGMTGDGDIDLGLRVLDFDGTIVPSYTANSILGDIPILGDIFVREKDGGLFALTYTVSGPFEKTQIAVNPLSALTPGFLRRIFKPNRETVPDSVRAKIEDVAPKIVDEK